MKGEEIEGTKYQFPNFRKNRKKQKLLSNFQEREKATTLLEFNESKNQFRIFAQMEISFYQSGTFGAPEFWCRHQNSGASPFFGGLFPLLRACLCWQCSDKIRKYGGLKESFRKKKENQIPYAGS